MPPAGPRSGSVRSKLIVNSILAVAFIAISAPQATRMPAHEWLSLAFIGILAFHLLFSWSWIVGVGQRFLSTLRGQVRFNFVLNSLSYLAMVAVMVSGIVISEAALPSLGFPRPRDRFWSMIHNSSSEALLVMIGVHLAMHWRWVMAASARFLTGTLGAETESSRAQQSWRRPTLTLAVVTAVVTLVTLGIGQTSAAERMRRPGGRARTAGVAAGGDDARTRTDAASGATSDGRQDGASSRVASSPASTPASGSGNEAATERPARPARRAGGGGGGGGGGANTLSWRQRYVQPTLKIGAYMGIPFLLTLVLLRITGGTRTGGTERSIDPLAQAVD